MTSHVSAEQSANSLPLAWQRLLALSGVAFAILFLVGWFASGGDAPDYGASDQDWTSWATDNQWKSRIGAFAMLLAGFVFLHFAATIRTALGDAEARVGGTAQLARVAFGGAITGMAGMVMAIVIISSATTEGAEVNPVVTRAIASASAGPFLLSAMGFAAFLMAGGLVTLRSGVSHAGRVSWRSSALSHFSLRSPRFCRAWAKTACSASASFRGY
jgi:succinate dehydrogenase/fumarate reductase cytochrome b subunit